MEVRDWALSKLLFHVCFVVNHSRTFGGSAWLCRCSNSGGCMVNATKGSAKGNNNSIQLVAPFLQDGEGKYSDINVVRSWMHIVSCRFFSFRSRAP